MVSGYLRCPFKELNKQLIIILLQSERETDRTVRHAIRERQTDRHKGSETDRQTHTQYSVTERGRQTKNANEPDLGQITGTMNTQHKIKIFTPDESFAD
jgi:hypothetical protein